MHTVALITFHPMLEFIVVLRAAHAAPFILYAVLGLMIHSPAPLALGDGQAVCEWFKCA